MIVDVITYNGEKELFDLRYNILKDYVDEFIVCEAPLTFSGKPKPLYFEEIKHKYEKVKYYVIDENDLELWEMAKVSPNTAGADHWKREFVHKESIKKALTHLKDDDIVFIGDCDEIWASVPNDDLIWKIKLRVYSYYLNNRSNEQFWGTIVGKYKNIKNECLNHLRSDLSKHFRTGDFQGWHFTSMGGYEEVKRKLSDSYTKDSYWTEGVESNLKDNVEKLKDFLGRGFVYWKDESEWPEYLKANKEKWKHLCL